MRDIVKKLCSRDPHQFFQRLETLARSVVYKEHSIAAIKYGLHLVCHFNILYLVYLLGVMIRMIRASKLV